MDAGFKGEIFNSGGQMLTHSLIAMVNSIETEGKHTLTEE